QESLVGRFEDALTARINNIRDRPEEFFANAVLLRAALGPTSTQPPVPPQHTPLSLPSVTQPQTVVDQAGLKPLLELALDERGAPRALAAPLHAAFLAGAVPLLVGGRAYQALAAYAACVTGGRCLWLPVPPTALAPADILGRVEAGRFLPVAGGL